MKERAPAANDRDGRPTTTLHHWTTPTLGEKMLHGPYRRPIAGLAGEPYVRNVILLTHPPLPSQPIDAWDYQAHRSFGGSRPQTLANKESFCVG